VSVPIFTLDDVSLTFGHLPLFEHADLRIDAGERIALIGRNGSGKSSLLRIVSGELLPDSGTIWRAPGSRTARLDQDVQGASDRTVFDEVADGLGELGALVGEYHHAAMAATQGARELERLGALQQELE
jgi:ATP-binding cassette subfamily F protein uup